MQIGSAHLLSGFLNWSEFNTSITTSISQVIGANPNRVALMFSASFTGPVFVSTKGSFNSGQGFALSSSQAVTVLTFRDIGAMCQAAWFARSSAGVGNVWVAEIYEVDTAASFTPSEPSS